MTDEEFEMEKQEQWTGEREQAQESSFLQEKGKKTARRHQNHQVPCGELHARRTSRILPNLAVVGWNMWGAFCPGVRRVETVRRHSKDCMERSLHTEPLNRVNPRHKLWLGVRNNSAECSVETAEGVFRAREVRRKEQQDRWDKEAINNVIGVPWRIVDGKWTLDRPTIQIDRVPPPPVPFEGASVQREKMWKPSEPAGCPGCNAMRSGRPTPTAAASGLRNVSK